MASCVPLHIRAQFTATLYKIAENIEIREALVRLNVHLELSPL